MPEPVPEPQTLQLQNDHETRLWCDVYVAAGGMRTVRIVGQANPSGAHAMPPPGVWEAADRAVMKLRERMPPKSEARNATGFCQHTVPGGHGLAIFRCPAVATMVTDSGMATCRSHARKGSKPIEGPTPEPYGPAESP